MRRGGVRLIFLRFPWLEEFVWRAEAEWLDDTRGPSAPSFKLSCRLSPPPIASLLLLDRAKGGDPVARR